MKQVVLKQELDAKPKAADFELIDVETPECPKDGLLVKVRYISLDPYVGTRLRGKHMGEAAPAPRTGLIPGAIVGEILESQAPGFKPGQFIHSMEGGWAEFIALKAEDVQIVDPEAAPLESYIGVLGMPGLTAWAGVTQLAKVRDGDVFLVNAAAGPVGGTAGQIARMKGAKTLIGIAGGQEKCREVEESYGFDFCLDYKQADWKDGLKKAAPDGISVHFENVGSDMLSLAMSSMQLYGRAVLCGLAAHYHEDGPPAMTSIGMVIGKRASLHGLVVYDYYSRWDEFRNEVAPWVKSGKVAYIHDEVSGLEKAPALMEKLMNGKNVGKCVVAL
ncbi:zinc-binding dehydrogenase [Litorimonas haliclonae]|uniref:zinc-binding dehydrogenase n=1 Tax=Litorimonas haliclonae TaxID=2081977 RepID=UPI0039F07D64